MTEHTTQTIEKKKRELKVGEMSIVKILGTKFWLTITEAEKIEDGWKFVGYDKH